MLPIQNVWIQKCAIPIRLLMNPIPTQIYTIPTPNPILLHMIPNPVSNPDSDSDSSFDSDSGFGIAPGLVVRQVVHQYACFTVYDCGTKFT